MNSEFQTFMASLYEPLLPRRASPSDAPPHDALVLGDDPLTRAPRWITAPELLTGMLVLGGSGLGKSNLLRVLLWRLLLRKLHFNEGFLVFDPHGTLCQWALKLIAAVAPWVAPEVYYYDFRQQRGKALQLGILSGDKERAYHGACVTVEGLLKGTGSSSSMDKPTLSRTLQNSFAALLELGLSFTDVRFFLQRGPAERAVLHTFLEQLSVGNPARAFFEDLEAKPAATQDTYAVGALNRTDVITRTRAIARTQCFAGVDLLPFMNNGWIGLIDGSCEGSGVSADARNATLSMLANRALATFEQRKPDRARPFTLVCDEWPDYISSSFARALSTVRKFSGRVLLSAQRLEDCVMKDGDFALLRAALAVPTKVVLGGLPFSECKTLSEEMFLRLIDPDRIKWQIDRIVWDPDMRKVVLRGRSRGGAATRTESETSTNNASVGGTKPPDGSDEAASWNRGDSDARGRSFADSDSWSDTEQEAWVNFPKPRVETGTPIFASIEEQIWLHAKKLQLQPRGHAVLSRSGELPCDIRLPHMQDFEFEDAAIEPFLEMVFDKPVYRDCVELDQHLDNRTHDLLRAAQPRIVGNSRSGKPRNRVRRGLIGSEDDQSSSRFED